MHFPANISPEKQQEVVKLLKRPRGTLEFEYQLEGIFDPKLGKGVILEIATGQVVYRIERDAELNLHFYHSSPGTGTRVASLDIKPLKGSKAIYLCITWSPEDIYIYVGGRNGGPDGLLSAKGIPSKKSFRVDSKGKVYQIGDEGVTIGEYSFFVHGKSILESTAIEAWNNTIEAVKILQSGTSSQGYIFEVICTNVTVVMLVTGFETYCKRRFLELEQEGILPGIDALLNSFLSAKERECGEGETIKTEAQESSISSLQIIVDSGRIDFQNYDRCKLAYNKAYGIKFGEVKGITSALLEDVQRMIGFRHRIVHVSPTIGMLNRGSVPPEEPVFPKREYAEKAINVFNDFIKCLHSATLSLESK